VKVGNEFFGMFEFRGREPRELIVCVFIAKPTDKVEEFAGSTAVDLRVYNFDNFILYFALNINGGWQRLNTVRNLIGCCGF
jgi:hypothetical protein